MHLAAIEIDCAATSTRHAAASTCFLYNSLIAVQLAHIEIDRAPMRLEPAALLQKASTLHAHSNGVARVRVCVHAHLSFQSKEKGWKQALTSA